MLARLAPVSVVLGTMLLVAWFGLDNHVRFNDEMLAVFGGRRMELEGVDVLFGSGGWERGPERLSAALMWVVNVLAPGGTAGEFVTAHVLWAAIWALGAIPVYLLARRLGVPALGAAAAAAIAVAGPSAIFGTTLLNTAPGFLTLVAAFTAAWRTAVRPSWRWDVALLVLGALAISARVGHAPFLLAVVPAILRATWMELPRGGRLRALPFALVRRHPVLVAAGVLALLVLLVRGRQAVLGGYGSEVAGQPIEAGQLWERVKIYGSRIALESGIAPFAIAVPWLVRELVRPRSLETGVLATLAAGGAAVLLYVFYNAPIEDRYLAIALPPLVVAAAVALTRGEVRPWSTAAFGLLVVHLVTQHALSDDEGGYAMIVEPAGRFVDMVAGQRLSLYVDTPHTTTIALLALLAAGVALAASAGRHARRRGALATVLCAGLVVYQVAAAGWAMDKFDTLVGRADLSWEQVTWVDEHASADVAYLSENRGVDPGLVNLSFDLAYFNRRPVVSAIEAGAPLPFTCCPPNANPAVLLTLDRDSGAVSAGGRLPGEVVVPPTWIPYSLRSDTVATGPDGFRLERLAGERPRLELATLSGTYPDGWGRPGRAIRLRTFDVPRGRCLIGAAGSPAGATAPTRVTVRGGETVTRFEVPPAGVAPLRIPLRPGTHELRITANAQPLDAERQATVRPGVARIDPC